jgi:hypothetical protein
VNLLLNYADAKFLEFQKVNSATGLSVGGFDRVLSFGPTDIDDEFASKNQHILEQPRGSGYWLWKPYFICRALASLSACKRTILRTASSFCTRAILPRSWVGCGG